MATEFCIAKRRRKRKCRIERLEGKMLKTELCATELHEFKLLQFDPENDTFENYETLLVFHKAKKSFRIPCFRVRGECEEWVLLSDIVSIVFRKEKTLECLARHLNYLKIPYVICSRELTEHMASKGLMNDMRIYRQQTALKKFDAIVLCIPLLKPKDEINKLDVRLMIKLYQSFWTFAGVYFPLKPLSQCMYCVDCNFSYTPKSFVSHTHTTNEDSPKMTFLLLDPSSKQVEPDAEEYFEYLLFVLKVMCRVESGRPDKCLRTPVVVTVRSEETKSSKRNQRKGRLLASTWNQE